MTGSQKRVIISYREKTKRPSPALLGLEKERYINMEKRNVKEAAIARETIYGVIEGHAEAMFGPVDYEFVGMATEGAILRDKATDTYIVLKAIAKAVDFDADDAMEEYAEKQTKAIEREQKKAAKVAKAKADKAKKEKEKEEVAE